MPSRRFLRTLLAATVLGLALLAALLPPTDAGDPATPVVQTSAPSSTP